MFHDRIKPNVGPNVKCELKSLFKTKNKKVNKKFFFWTGKCAELFHWSIND